MTPEDRTHIIAVALGHLDAAAMPTKSEVYVVCGSEAAELRDAIKDLVERDTKVRNLVMTASGMNQPLYTQDLLDALR